MYGSSLIMVAMMFLFGYLNLPKHIACQNTNAAWLFNRIAKFANFILNVNQLSTILNRKIQRYLKSTVSNTSDSERTMKSLFLMCHRKPGNLCCDKKDMIGKVTLT